MPSIRGRLVRWIVQKVTTKGTTYQKPISQQRREMEERMGRIKVSRKVRIQRVDCSGVPGEWVIPRNLVGNRVVLYCHGGGYYNCSLGTHRAFVARLALALKARVLQFDYRLAPEHPFPAAVADSLKVYRWLLSQAVDPTSIMIAGESAGGNLVMTTLLGAKNGGLALPACAVCLSPHVDFTFSGKSIRDNAESELLYTLKELEWTREIYLGDRASDNQLWKDAMVSPMMADLSGLPPLLIHVDDTEMLRDDGVTLAARANLAGVVTELRVWEGLFHAFALVSMIPEAGRVLKEIAVFGEKHWGIKIS
ncbi:MAG: alpha/beta hydrolase [Magnetococcus sp. THC-1_WYH]